MRQILILLFFGLAFSGCVTQPRFRAASEYLLTTDKGTTSLFTDLKAGLGEHKYTVEKEDSAAGILLLAPRPFSYASGGHKVSARQIVQMRQEGGSVKVRISYECKYASEFEACLENDSRVSEKIGRIENSLVEVIQPIMLKYKEDGSSPMPASVGKSEAH